MREGGGGGGTGGKTLKGDGTKKRGGETKILKKGASRVKGGWHLKKGADWDPLTNYVNIMLHSIQA